jgi:hypothetical protein
MEVYDSPGGGRGFGGMDPLPVGGGFGLPSVEDIARQRSRRFGVVTWVEMDTATVAVVDVAQQATFRVDPVLLSYPLTFRWTVFGFQVPAGAGTVVNGGRTITYDEESVRLEVTAPIGVDLVGQVCVTVIDADGRQVNACIAINRPSRKRTGGCTQGRPLTTMTDLLLFANEYGGAARSASMARAELRSLVEGRTIAAAVEPKPLREALRRAPRGRKASIRLNSEPAIRKSRRRRRR